MEIKRQERGRFRGNIDIMATMDTMQVGETWRVKEGVVALRTIRNCVSTATNRGDKVFTSQCPGLTEPWITIRRIR